MHVEDHPVNYGEFEGITVKVTRQSRPIGAIPLGQPPLHVGQRLGRLAELLQRAPHVKQAVGEVGVVLLGVKALAHCQRPLQMR